jgi:DNA-binding protein H-NS
MKNLKNMSFDQLVSLRETVDDMISGMAAKVKESLHEKLVWIDSLTGKRRSARQQTGHALRGRKVAPKYRNPGNRTETWAGRGAMPRWLRALVQQGHKPEEFAIDRKAAATKGKARKTARGRAVRARKSA